MGIRETLNTHPGLVAGTAIVLALLAVGVLVWSAADRGPTFAGGMYYYDMEADALFVAEPGQFPPIPAPSGERAGVRAHVFGCGPGDCPGARRLAGKSWQQIESETDAFVGYFQRYSDEAQRFITRAMDEDDPPVDQMQQAEARGLLVRAPGDTEWVAQHSVRGGQIVDQAAQRCDDPRSLRRCDP